MAKIFILEPITGSLSDMGLWLARPKLHTHTWTGVLLLKESNSAELAKSSQSLHLYVSGFITDDYITLYSSPYDEDWQCQAANQKDIIVFHYPLLQSRR